MTLFAVADVAVFLSTPSARRATTAGVEKTPRLWYTFLSTPSARRATFRSPRVPLGQHNFYPRPPRGGRHKGRNVRVPQPGISIHALREEGDTRARGSTTTLINFYPRPPRGGRRRKLPSRMPTRYFYPRPPRGGRRRTAVGYRLKGIISIHALREEGDAPTLKVTSPPTVFLSTPSARRATFSLPRSTATAKLFLSTPSARRATIIFSMLISSNFYFYPRPPRGGRLTTRIGFSSSL